MKSVFDHPLRVCYADTDCTGVVYHTNYLRMMEQARTEWMANLAERASEKVMEPMSFAIRQLQVEFKSPARFNEQLIVRVYLEKIKRASIVFYHEIIHAVTKKIYCQATVEVVCIDDQVKPCPMPKTFLSLLAAGDVSLDQQPLRSS